MSAVMDVDYSPTGREFVAGSYDRSVRIFGFNAGHSREVGGGTQQEWGGVLVPLYFSVCCQCFLLLAGPLSGH